MINGWKDNVENRHTTIYMNKTKITINEEC